MKELLDHKKKSSKSAEEGYVYVSYGNEIYLSYVIASVVSLRRYDVKRPVALFCSSNQITYLRENELEDLFDVLSELPDEHASIVGFKHNVHLFGPFNKNLFLDSDILWLKNPDCLWKQWGEIPYTITGNPVSDIFFGASKGVSVAFDVLLNRRRKTLKKFGLTYLSRVQSGMIFMQDKEVAQEVGRKASEFLTSVDETHFISRRKEKGRTEESCEWSLAMAMSHFNIGVYPWYMGEHSPQLDFIEAYTRYDADFENVTCLYYTNPFEYSLRGLKATWLRNLIHSIIQYFPGKGDYRYVTPYTLHFGWFHQKQPFYDFAERTMNQLLNPNSVSSAK